MAFTLANSAKEQIPDNPCKFKSQYFTEFDLTTLTKPKGEALYTTSELSFENLFTFNFCEYIPESTSYV